MNSAQPDRKPVNLKTLANELQCATDDAVVGIARAWCEENEVPYTSG